MEPPVPPGPGPAPQPTPSWPSPVVTGRPPYRPTPYLLVRSRADRKLAIGAVVGGVSFDIAAHSGLATVAVTAWLVVVAAAILFSGRVRGLVSKLLIASAAALGLLFFLRSSPWVLAPTAAAVVVLLLLGVSLGADGAGVGASFPALAGRLGVAVGHFAIAAGMFRFSGPAGQDDVARKRVEAVARAALLGVPVLIVVGLLLARADPIFRSWFDLAPLLRHFALIVVGAWVAVGLGRAASAKDPVPAVQSAPSLGVLEVSLVLGGLCALYGAFVVAQFVALSGAGHRILVTQGLTYAQYARSGFFQLLACAAITLVVLLGLRACTDKTRLIPAVLAGLTTVLTIGVVIVAIRRLDLYETAYGLTMLRLASLAAAVWIGVVFVLLATTIVAPGRLARLFPATVAVSGLVLVAAWGIANPASIVAVTDLHRAGHGHRLDVEQVARLGPDAVPALAAGLGGLDPTTRVELRQAICARAGGKDTGTSFNLAGHQADAVKSHLCG